MSHCTSMRRRMIDCGLLLLALAASGLGGCDRSDGGQDPPRQRPAAAPDAAPTPPGDLVTPTLSHPTRPQPEPSFLGLDEAVILDAIKGRRIIGGRATSGASLSFYFNLEGDIDAAFKPNTSRGQRWTGEIAAYRLDQLLGLNRVPPATIRRLQVPMLRSLIEDDQEQLARFDDEVVADHGTTIRGAVIYWVPTIHRAEVDRLEELEQWTRWLRQGGTIPPERLSHAQQLSDLIVFDYLTGNWDRWSGSNVLWGPERQTLLMMDNNGAFNAVFAEPLTERLRAPLEQVERFSALLVHRLRQLDERELRAALGRTDSGDLLLTDEQLDALFERRGQILGRLDELVARHGQDAVLCFH